MTALVNSGTAVICVCENNRSYLKFSMVICRWENKAVKVLVMGTWLAVMIVWADQQHFWDITIIINKAVASFICQWLSSNVWELSTENKLISPLDDYNDVAKKYHHENLIQCLIWILAHSDSSLATEKSVNGKTNWQKYKVHRSRGACVSTSS